jgi:hypothetical protein
MGRGKVIAASAIVNVAKLVSFEKWLLGRLDIVVEITQDSVNMVEVQHAASVVCGV